MLRDIGNLPYKIKDKEDNIFVFGYYENGHPVYRTFGGSKHIFENQLKFYKVVEQHQPI